MLVSAVGALNARSIMYFVIGALVSWCGTFVLYGFGELIEKVSDINRKLDRMNDNIGRTSINSNQALIFQQKILDSLKESQKGSDK